MISYSFKKYPLQFNFSAKTSRGAITEHVAYFIIAKNTINKLVGIGEASPLKGLSIDATDNFEIRLTEIISLLNAGTNPNTLDLTELPAAKFALETAWADLTNGGNKLIFNNGFICGVPIKINGLVWMADAETMYREAISKIESGFNCIKLKVGALDFDEECRLLEKIRKKYNAFKTEIRLDANGAFYADDVFEKLNNLKRFDIHSIEQPLKPNHHHLMQEVCAKSKISIALDEELITVNINDALNVLKYIKPAFIIIKPTLIGGFNNADAWINAAQQLNIGWWATSALESNIGLNAIAQWVFGKQIKLHQGLGTGSLYTNNIPSPLQVTKGHIVYNKMLQWNVTQFT